MNFSPGLWSNLTLTSSGTTGEALDVHGDLPLDATRFHQLIVCGLKSKMEENRSSSSLQSLFTDHPDWTTFIFTAILNLFFRFTMSVRKNGLCLLGLAPPLLVHYQSNRVHTEVYQSSLEADSCFRATREFSQMNGDVSLNLHESFSSWKHELHLNNI